MRRLPNLCFIGSMMGRNSGLITTQGQIATDLFARDGFNVISASPRRNRAARLADIIWTLIKNRAVSDLVVIEVYAGLSFVMADAASLVCKILCTPVVMVLHGGDLPRFAKKYPRWTERVFRRAAQLAAPSDFLAKVFAAKGFDVRVIPNVIAIENYPFRARRNLSPNLLWMRSFHPIYNPHMAIEVFSRIRGEFPDARLTMAGVNKGLEPEIREMVSDLGLSDVVSFPGFLDVEKKKKLFDEADIFLNTNRIDNMPVAVAEARAFGLPVVATRVGGLPALIRDGVDGLLVPDDDASAMADAVKRLLTDPELASRISRAGRKRAELLSWESVRVKWDELFAEIVPDREGTHVTVAAGS